MRGKLILFYLLILSLVTVKANAVGIGAYATVSGGKTTQSIKSNSLTLLYTYVTLPQNYKTVSVGGGLVFDTNLASMDVFNYRLKVGVEQHTARRETSMKLTRMRLDQIFGIGVVHTDNIRWFIGPVIEGKYTWGDNVGYLSSIMSYGAAAGLATGVNLNLGKNLTLGVEGGFKYGIEWTDQRWKTFYKLYPNAWYYLNRRRTFPMRGYEAYGSVAVLFRAGSDSHSKIRYVEAKQ